MSGNKMVYHMWDPYELPTIRSNSFDIWSVKATNGLERSRCIIIVF